MSKGEVVMSYHEYSEFKVVKDPYREGYYYVWMRLDDTEFSVYLIAEEINHFLDEFHRVGF